jgi:hypothetical protein
MPIIKPRIDLDIWPQQRAAAHGSNTKDLFVFHETVSPDAPGLSDITGVSGYLSREGYGIHGILDAEGHLAWCVGHSSELFYHATSTGAKDQAHARVNTRGIGLELISNIPLIAGTPQEPRLLRQTRAWAKRQIQLHRAARVLEWQSRVHHFPLILSEGATPGVTTHYQITMHFGVPGGHTDCHPIHLGGYFPIKKIIRRARFLRATRLRSA